MTVLGKISSYLTDRLIKFESWDRKYAHGSGGPEPRMTVLPEASSNLPDRPSRKRTGTECTREVYMFCSGTIEKAALKKAKKVHLAGKPLNLYDISANGQRDCARWCTRSKRRFSGPASQYGILYLAVPGRNYLQTSQNSETVVITCSCE